jgi:hypothetical protein
MRARDIGLIAILALGGCAGSVGDALEERYIAANRSIAGWFGDALPPAPAVEPPETGGRRMRLGEIRERPEMTPAPERRAGFATMEAARTETQAIEAELIGRHGHTPNNAAPTPPQAREVVRPIATIAPPDRAGRLDPAQRSVIASVAETLRERQGRFRLVGPRAAVNAVAAELRRNNIDADRITIDPRVPAGTVGAQIFVDL